MAVRRVAGLFMAFSSHSRSTFEILLGESQALVRLNQSDSEQTHGTQLIVGREEYNCIVTGTPHSSDATLTQLIWINHLYAKKG
jgi:hypothetical protein